MIICLINVELYCSCTGFRSDVVRLHFHSRTYVYDAQPKHKQKIVNVRSGLVSKFWGSAC